MHVFFDTIYEKAFFRDTVVTVGALGAVLGQLAIFGLIALHGDVFWGSGSAFLYLHYKIFMGVDYFARWQYIFLLPFSGLICGGVNYVLTRSLFYSHKTSARILMICAAIFQYILLFAIYLLIQINIF